MKSIFGVLFILLSCSATAQVINTERLRLNAKDQGWVGSFNASFSQSQSTIKIQSLSLRTGMEYVKDPVTILLVGQLSLSKKDNTVNLANAGFFHARLGHALSRSMRWETFGQVQYHEFKKIGIRSLSGTGARFTLSESDSLKVFWGALYMYEYEKLFAEDTYNRAHRMSTYLSAAYRFTDFFFIDFIAYYQPLWRAPSDFRISSETIVNFDLTQSLNFRIIFNYGYDSRPPEGIPRINYNWSNSLGLTF